MRLLAPVCIAKIFEMQMRGIAETVEHDGWEKKNGPEGVRDQCEAGRVDSD
jgi:hypothetical protein